MSATQELLRFGSFELNLATGELRNTGTLVKLPPLPFKMLVLLAKHAGQIVTRQEIQEQLWGTETFVDFEQSVNKCIKQIRTALNDNADDPLYIETLPRHGYRFLAPVVSKTIPAPQPKVVESKSGIQPLPGAAKMPEKPPATETYGAQDGALPGPKLEPVSLAGKAVSHYRVLNIIGGGGIGVVYKAEDLKLPRAVALKLLPEEVSNDPVALEQFAREARSASVLDHPNICSIYEFGEHEGRPFIVMQLLEGQTLRDLLALTDAGDSSGKALPLDQLLRIAVQTTDGLEAAHEKSIIHRDIKPANIFITTKGVAKILDFGLAKPIQKGEKVELGVAAEMQSTSSPSSGTSPALSPTFKSLVTGTAAYMSPEQVRGQKLDARTDLFSFGLVLYEMATGRQAFQSDSVAGLQDAILNSTPTPVPEINPKLPAELQGVIQKCMERDRELRYQHAGDIRSDLERIKRKRQQPYGLRHWKLLAVAAMVVVALLAGGLYWRAHKKPVLTEKDTIVLADFDNKTGDPVSDDTLKQGLSIQLEQSPFLDLISESKVNQSLKLMGRPAGDRLTPEITREVCQRTGSKAMLTGSIAALGSQYVIGLKAVDCNTGDMLAEAQAQAAGKEQVFKALDNAAVSLRSKLGETLTSVQKYATPLYEATTPSLEALLQAYSLGRKTRFAKGDTAALPFFKRAVELDPNFAIPYVAMSMAYGNLGETGRETENARKAYKLREKVSERERFAIEATYYLDATGELEKAAQTYELWQQAYPRDDVPYSNLGFVYGSLGNSEKALEEDREAIRLEPNDESNYVNLGNAYANLNKLGDAEAVYRQAKERKLEGEHLLAGRYELAFLKEDTAQMMQLVSTAVGKPGTEDLLLAMQADTEAWHGKLKNARELTLRAMDSAQHNDAREATALYQAAAALREVESGNRKQAIAEAHAALKLAPNRDVRAMAALALSRAGDTAGAEKLAAELDRKFPLDTLMQRYWLPTIWAAAAIERKDANRAIGLLKVASAIELGLPTNVDVSLCPVYFRGEAYLMLHDGNAAAVEFQKFVDHYGLVVNFPWGALARLGLARAYAMQGNTAKARTSYQDFLTLWKDADPDIPIYRQAKAEYAKLQ